MWIFNDAANRVAKLTLHPHREHHFLNFPALVREGSSSGERKSAKPIAQYRSVQ